jgi:hypothetical protein
MTAGILKVATCSDNIWMQTNVEKVPWRASDILTESERDRFESILFLCDCLVMQLL